MFRPRPIFWPEKTPDAAAGHNTLVLRKKTLLASMAHECTDRTSQRAETPPPEESTKGGGAKRRPLGIYTFVCIGQPIFVCIGQPRFFLHWPSHIFLHLAIPYFFGGPPIHIISASLFVFRSMFYFSKKRRSEYVLYQEGAMYKSLLSSDKKNLHH